LRNEKNIQFTLIYQGKQVTVDTFANEFSDLRALIMAKLDLDFFGECGGVGRCVTCVVSVNSTDELKANSEEFACQMLVDKNLDNIYIRVIGDRLKEF
jgi:2Fe-2S ferredoxin